MDGWNWEAILGTFAILVAISRVLTRIGRLEDRYERTEKNCEKEEAAKKVINTTLGDHEKRITKLEAHADL